MLKITTTPTNTEILKRDGGILKATFIIIIGCITFSVATEFMFFFFSLSAYLDFFNWLSYPIAFFITCFLIYLIESKGIEFLKYFIDCILYRRVKSDFWLFLFCVFIVGICYTASYKISMGGLPSITKQFIETPNIQTTSKIDSTLNAERLMILSNYSNDSLAITTNHKNQISTIKREYQSKIEKVKTDLADYKRKEKRTGKSYTTAKNRVRRKIATLKTEQAQRVGKIEATKGIDLKNLITERKASLKAIESTHKNEKERIGATNHEEKTVYKDTLTASNIGWGYGILFSIPALFICVFIQRIIFKKSGITEEHQFDDYFYRESIFSKLFNLARVRVLYWSHIKLDAQFEKLKIDDYRPKVNKVFQRQELTQYINPKGISNDQMNLADDTRIQPTAQLPISDDTLTDIKNHIYENRITNNSTAILTKPKKEKKNDTNKSNLRRCEHCDKEYQYRHHKQKYCSDECRKKAWEAKTGKKLKLKARK